MSDEASVLNVPGTMVRVRCCGELHRVLVTERGEIVLLDHERGSTLDTALALAGASCRCEAVRRRVIAFVRGFNLRDSKGHRLALPAGLNEAAEDLRERRQLRHHVLGHGRDPLLAVKRAETAGDRLRAKRLAEIAAEVQHLEAALKDRALAGYRGGSCRWIDKAQTTVSVWVWPSSDHAPRVEGETTNVWHRNRSWSGTRLCLAIEATLRDAREAARLCGLGMISSTGAVWPVVHVETVDGETVVTTGRQRGNALAVVPARAVVTLGARGKPCVFKRWLP